MRGEDLELGLAGKDHNIGEGRSRYARTQPWLRLGRMRQERMCKDSTLAEAGEDVRG